MGARGFWNVGGSFWMMNVVSGDAFLDDMGVILDVVG